MTLIAAYGRNGKIFSVWRCRPDRREFQFHTGNRVVCKIHARPPGWTYPLDYKARRCLQGHPLLEEALEKHLNAEKLKS